MRLEFLRIFSIAFYSFHSRDDHKKLFIKYSWICMEESSFQLESNCELKIYYLFFVLKCQKIKITKQEIESKNCWNDGRDFLNKIHFIGINWNENCLGKGFGFMMMTLTYLVIRFRFFFSFHFCCCFCAFSLLA